MMSVCVCMAPMSEATLFFKLTHVFDGIGARRGGHLRRLFVPVIPSV